MFETGFTICSKLKMKILTIQPLKNENINMNSFDVIQIELFNEIDAVEGRLNQLQQVEVHTIEEFNLYLDELTEVFEILDKLAQLIL